ncbi:Beta-glucanase, GH16 family [Selenomonas ruminantium]|uniref:Beta-glucanase n=1 Tax=Selenomonas ruminantium TaxID=971 RepID=A0A1I3GU06_SELRU|nr:glycoside hydrolase family 16 protein [Selenomonas ruminantium]SFI26841.1 Beta-glucanase, GH16 family [Selenomonas ruminantium]
MMDIRKKALAVAVLAALAAPVSVSLDVVSPAIVSAAPAAETKASDAFTIDLTKGGQNDISIPSDGWTNGNPFNVFWHKENVTFEDGAMQLIVDASPNPAADKVPYSGGEYRTKNFYGYGRFETTMKAIKNDGVVSSFFTCTGPYDNGNDWDEIDFEVLGKDTTKVQLNYFRKGVGGHEKMIDLGFDASEDFHTYAFEWHKNSIIWYVDGKEVYRVEGGDLPCTKGRILMNAWCGKGVDEWLKPFKDDNMPLVAEYKSIKYTPFAE